jgi:hypothetical protein
LQGPLGAALSPTGDELLTTSSGAAKIDSVDLFDLNVVPFGDPGAPTNPATAAMAKASARWDFKHADATPEIALNRAIWKSVRGRHTRMPKPRHVRIVGSRPNDED